MILVAHAMDLSTSGGLVSILTVLATSHVVYLRYIHRLALVPCPLLASITRLWLVAKARTWQRHQIEINNHKKYGSIARLSPNGITASDPKYV